MEDYLYPVVIQICGGQELYVGQAMKRAELVLRKKICHQLKASPFVRNLRLTIYFSG